MNSSSLLFSLLFVLASLVNSSSALGQYCPSTGSIAHESEFDFQLCKWLISDTCCTIGGEADIFNFHDQATTQSGPICPYNHVNVRPLLATYFCSPCYPDLEDYTGIYPDLTYNLSGTNYFAFSNASLVMLVPTLFFCDSWMDEFLGIRYQATVNWTTQVVNNNGTQSLVTSTFAVGTSNYDECGLWNPTQTVCLNNGVYLPGSYYNPSTGTANYNQFLHDIQLQSTYNVIGSVSVPDDDAILYSMQSVVSYPGASVTNGNLVPAVTIPVNYYNVTFPKKCFRGSASTVSISLGLTLMAIMLSYLFTL